MRLSAHFELSEFTHSETADRLGIDNYPGVAVEEEVIDNLRELARFLELIRAAIDAPVYINSGYRCKRLNEELQGSKNSQHMRGQAADIHFDNFDEKKFDVLMMLVESSRVVLFDQVIFYPTFIHVSYARGKNRGIILDWRKSH